MNLAAFNFIGGFLIFSREAFFGLDFETLTQTIYGTIVVGSLEYWKLVLQSEGHGYTAGTNRFTCFDTDEVSGYGDFEELGRIRFHAGECKKGQITETHHKLMYISLGNGQTKVWAFIPGHEFSFQNFIDNPKTDIKTQIEFEQLVIRIKELGLSE